MSIPATFVYPNEEAFTRDCIIPLLHQLGFGVVENYHGTREFGKDLICGTFDNFGDTLFYGIQVKYETSIGLNSVESLIRDSKQAFRNPFRHPRTGTEHRIAFFIAINGGSISDQAKEHFFNSLDDTLRPYARLIDGKSLVSLHKFVSWREVQRIREQITGMVAEVEANRKLKSVGRLADFVQRISSHDREVPLERLRNNCVSAYLANPSLPDVIQAWEAHKYWQATQSLNRFLDILSQPGYMVVEKDRKVIQDLLSDVSFGHNTYRPERGLLYLDQLFPL